MYMLHMLVADDECAQAFATADYGITHMLRLMAYFDVAAALRCGTPKPAAPHKGRGGAPSGSLAATSTPLARLSAEIGGCVCVCVCACTSMFMKLCSMLC
jgi:hypothetical protein